MKITDNDKRIFYYLDKFKFLDCSSIVLLTGKYRRYIQSRLLILFENGFLKREQITIFHDYVYWNSSKAIAILALGKTTKESKFNLSRMEHELLLVKIFHNIKINNDLNDNDILSEREYLRLFSVAKLKGVPDLYIKSNKINVELELHLKSEKRLILTKFAIDKNRHKDYIFIIDRRMKKFEQRIEEIKRKGYINNYTIYFVDDIEKNKPILLNNLQQSFDI